MTAVNGIFGGNDGFKGITTNTNPVKYTQASSGILKFETSKIKESDSDNFYPGLKLSTHGKVDDSTKGVVLDGLDYLDSFVIKP